MKEFLEDVQAGRSTGLFDIKHRELFDGDEVLTLNAYAPDGIPGLVGTVRLLNSGGKTLWIACGTGISCSAEPEFGVYKLVRE